MAQRLGWWDVSEGPSEGPRKEGTWGACEGRVAKCKPPEAPASSPSPLFLRNPSLHSSLLARQLHGTIPATKVRHSITASLHLFPCPIWSSVGVFRTLRDRHVLNFTKIVDLNVAMDAFDAFAIAAGVHSSIPFY